MDGSRIVPSRPTAQTVLAATASSSKATTVVLVPRSRTVLRMAQQQSQILLNGRILHRTDPAADCVPCPRRAISGVKFCPVVAAAGVAICCGREEGRKKVYRLPREKRRNLFLIGGNGG